MAELEMLKLSSHVTRMERIKNVLFEGQPSLDSSETI